MRAQGLDARKQRILWAVIQEYVARAEPVASESLCRRYGLEVSAATIRNGMHALTEMGYLHQPHTSAGRVPTDRAYRFYVDQLMTGQLQNAFEQYLRPAEREWIRRRVRSYDHPEDVLAEATHILASLTDYASVATTPGGPRRFRYLQVVPLKEDRALMVLVMHGAPPDQRVVRLGRPASEEELQEVSRWMSQALSGVALEHITDATVAWLVRTAPTYRDLVAAVAGHLKRYAGSSTSVRFFVDGASNILKQPEFQDVRRARPVLAALDREEVLREVLLPAPVDVHVRIGRENPVDDMWGCSVVAAAYQVSGVSAGVVGVVGPTRMPYARTIALVRFLAHTISQALSQTV